MMKLASASILVAGFLTRFSYGDTIHRRPNQTDEDLAAAVLPAGRQLAHAVVRGDFGPGRGNLVVLHQAIESADRNFAGAVLVGGPRDYETHALPPLDLVSGRFEIDILSVFFANGNHDKLRQELFVLYAYHRNGSQDDDGFAVACYEWNGKAFVTAPVESKLVGLKTAAAVKHRLRTLGF